MLPSNSLGKDRDTLLGASTGRTFQPIDRVVEITLHGIAVPTDLKRDAGRGRR